MAGSARTYRVRFLLDASPTVILFGVLPARRCCLWGLTYSHTLLEPSGTARLCDVRRGTTA